MAVPNLMQIDPDDFTMGEVVDLEEYTGIPMEDWSGYRWPGQPNDGRPPLPKRIVIGLLWIAGRRDDPSYTIADATNVKISDLNVVPTPAAPTLLEPLDKPAKQPVRKRAASAA